MTSITVRPDDGGIQSLKKENRAPATTRELGPAAPINRTQSTQEYPPTPPQTRARPTYKGPDRRKGERRQTKKDRLILDTRDKRERRRQIQNVNQDAKDIEDAPKIGIDVFG